MGLRLTEMASHGFVPTRCCSASRAIRAYTSAMPRGAGTGPGRAKGALMSALSDGESFDMLPRVVLLSLLVLVLLLRSAASLASLSRCVLASSSPRPMA